MCGNEKEIEGIFN